jgi:sec-independent protein translocase protein TatA
MFGLGVPEILIIALIILLIFGAKRLPSIGAGLGQTVREIGKIKKDLSGDKEPSKETGANEASKAESESLEGKVTASLQKKVTDKVLGQVPGIKQAKQIKDKADKIKKIVS